jgi:hypothetical protein
MKHHQPVTSYHLRFISQCAPYLLVEVQQEQPRNTALRSILSQYVAIAPDFAGVEGFDAMGVSEHFSAPRFSTAYLEHVHAILLERDLKVSRLQQTLTTIAESFLARQDQEVQRNPSRPAGRRLIVSPMPYAGHHYPIVGPHQVVPVANLVGCWIEDGAIRALYKSTFHTIRKLTRGSRSLAKGNGYE